MTAHVAYRPDVFDGHEATGCFLVCPQHDLRISFGFESVVAVAACREHNAIHHPKHSPNDGRLLSVVYRSDQVEGVTETDLAAILLAARHRNSALGITGMLLAQHGRFLQALEGPELLVRDLLAAIMRDRRHEHLEVLAEDFVTARRFPDWAMADASLEDVTSLPFVGHYEALLIARGTVVR